MIKYFKRWWFCLKVLICDDEKIYTDELSKYVSEYMEAKKTNFDLTVTQSPNEIMATNTCYDLVFLDIQMDGVNGITLAEELKRRNEKTIIFFITSYNEYQDSAMDLRAFRYFEKPFNPTRLFSSLDKAMEYLDVIYVDVFFYSGNLCKKIPTDKIISIRRENRKTIMSTFDGEYIVREPLEKWVEKLPLSYFYLVHKSFFVNLHYIDQYTYSELIMTNRERIPIAPRKQADFHKYWYSYLKRR